MPYNSTWKELPKETGRSAINFYALQSIEKLKSQLSRERDLGVELRKRIMSLKRGRAPVISAI